MATTTKWKINGTYFESCDCDIACPCVFLQSPSTDDGACNVVIAWNIESGDFGGTKLDGLSVALAVHSPKIMTDGNWKAAVYLDENADSAQQEALGQIFSGQGGGHFEVLSGFIGEILGVATASIDYRSDGKKRGVTIGNIAEIEIEAILGVEGEDVTIAGNPLGVVPGVPLHIAQSSVSKFSDHGLTWDNAGNNGFFSAFSYEN